MWKTILAGTTALVVVGSDVVLAQQRPATPDAGQGARPVEQNAQDATAFAEARIAALHAGLMLTPDQDKNWPAFEQAVRDLIKMRTELRGAGPGGDDAGSPIDRLGRMGELMTRRGTALKRLADAAAPLYQSLDEAQKRRFVILGRPLSRGGAAMSWHHEHGGMGMGPGGGMGMMGRGGMGMGPGFGGRDGSGIGPGMRGGQDFHERFGMGPRGPGMGGMGFGRDDDFRRGPGPGGQDWRDRPGPDGGRRGMGPGPRPPRQDDDEHL